MEKAKFRKKPVVIEASQWKKMGDHENVIAIPASVLEREMTEGIFVSQRGFHPDVCGWIGTLEGGHIVFPNDWIITGVKGEQYPCKPDIFEATYEHELKTQKEPLMEGVKSAEDFLKEYKVHTGEAYLGGMCLPRKEVERMLNAYASQFKQSQEGKQVDVEAKFKEWWQNQDINKLAGKQVFNWFLPYLQSGEGREIEFADWIIKKATVDAHDSEKWMTLDKRGLTTSQLYQEWKKNKD